VLTRGTDKFGAASVGEHPSESDSTMIRFTCGEATGTRPSCGERMACAQQIRRPTPSIVEDMCNESLVLSIQQERLADDAR
jgi:hypothetical protein